MNNLDKANKLIRKLEKVIINPQNQEGDILYTGIDLGTAVVAVIVVNTKGEPVAGAYEFANVVRDGMVIDYSGSIGILTRLKEKIENDLKQELLYASVALPPGTSSIDGGAVKNVAEAAGFEVLKVLDEPSAANFVLEITDGAIVDIGGGTTGISIVKDGLVCKTTDEATGGRHFSLVLAGAKHISYEEAEALKKDFRIHREIFPIVSPVVDKISSIILNSIGGYEIEEIYLVGGTALMMGIEDHIQKETGIKTVKPLNPILVTPLGLAISLVKEDGLYGN